MTTVVLVKRDERGRVLPGYTPNPAGRPKVVAEIRDMARAEAPAAFRRVCELVQHEDPRIALAASVEILNRAYGKSPQSIQTEKRILSHAELYLRAVIDAQPIDAAPVIENDPNGPEDNEGQIINQTSDDW
jgi:hypothetical protein